MSFSVTSLTVSLTQSAHLQYQRKHIDEHGHGKDVQIDLAVLSEADLEDLRKAATEADDAKSLRAIEVIDRAREGDFKVKVPNFNAFQEVLTAYLSQSVIDGWIYVVGEDGSVYPEVVTKITYESNLSSRISSPPSVIIHTSFYGRVGDDKKTKMGVERRKHHFHPSDVTRRTIDAILAGHGIYHETPELKKDHEDRVKRYREDLQPRFADQFVVTGIPVYYENNSYAQRGTSVEGRKVIHDLDGSCYGPMAGSIDCPLVGEDGVSDIPVHPVLRVYDLKTHDLMWVGVDIIKPYQYDLSLRDKLILPESHHDLLDVLTTDIGAFTEDFIDGKKAGNVVLCKGTPGLGKTLTAEVYSEIIKRPLISIHAGNLGVDPDEIAKNLDVYFIRAKRWGVPLLLDEVDVYVSARGADIHHNAVVATFLRTLEYYDGLLWLTTNRAKTIDDAIISRCAAIINYSTPNTERLRKIWTVMATQFGHPLSHDLLEELLGLFPSIAPRDIKMLFRLALRFSHARGEALGGEVFRKCAMFRAIEMPETATGDSQGS